MPTEAALSPTAHSLRAALGEVLNTLNLPFWIDSGSLLSWWVLTIVSRRLTIVVAEGIGMEGHSRT